MTRGPVTAGTFYERDRAGLVQSIERCFVGELGPGRLPILAEQRAGRVLGLVCPHAGYVYSGSAAAHAYDALASDGLPHTIVLLGPNHTGLGVGVAVSAESEWSTPLGTMSVDQETADAIIGLSEFAESDNLAHAREHSIEVQLPFLQYLGIAREALGSATKDECDTPSPLAGPVLSTVEGEGRGEGGAEAMKIVPISIAHFDLDDAIALSTDLGAAIAKALQGKSAIVIASTDLSHYESKFTAQAQDELAIEQIANLDPAGLLRVVYGRSITMCGVIGTAVMIEACKALGATTARKLAYYTSGDVTGDTSQVVGYGSLEVTGSARLI